MESIPCMVIRGSKENEWENEQEFTQVTCLKEGCGIQAERWGATNKSVIGCLAIIKSGCNKPHHIV